MIRKTKNLAFLLIPILLLVLTPPAFANSLPVYWQGYPSFEVLMVDKNSPIEVKSEHLLFDLSKFNQHEYTISGEVTAVYEMFNPTNESVSVQMAFPFISKISNLSKNDISITADNENIPYDIYISETVDSYGASFDQGNIPVDFSKITETITTGSYQGKCLSENDEGILYTFEVVPEKEERIHFAVAFNEIDSNKTKIVSDGFHAFEGGQNYMKFSGWCNEKNYFEIFVFGEQLDFEIEGYTDGSHKVKSDNFSYNISQKVIDVKSFIEDKVEKVNAEKTEYSEIIASCISNVGKSQVYKMYISTMDKILTHNGYVAWDDIEHQFFLSKLIIMVYTVEFPPNSVKTISVGYRALGTMDSRKTSKPLYTFSYLLTPARYWAAFSNLNIEIITPTQAPHIVQSSIEFESTKPYHFAASLASLPENDLFFTIHGNKKINIQEKKIYNSKYIYSLSNPLIIVISMLILFAVITAVSLIIYRYKK